MILHYKFLLSITPESSLEAHIQNWPLYATRMPFGGLKSHKR